MQLYTIEQAAEMLGVSVRVVQTLLRRGHLTYIDVSANSYGRKPRKRISDDDIAKFVEKRRRGPEPPKTSLERRLRWAELD